VTAVCWGMPAPNLTLLSARLGSLVLLVQGAMDPSMEDWEKFLDHTAEAMAENDGRCRVIVFTRGGKPNAAQRARSFERGWHNNRLSPAAVVSDDRLVRGVITVFSWFGLNIRAVRPDRWEDAADHLALTTEEQAWISGERRDLEQRLDASRSGVRAAATHHGKTTQRKE
jgi:hypothetical protein